MRLVPALLLALSVCQTAGCAQQSAAPVSAAQYQANAEEAYQKALRRFNKRDWVNANALMEEVKREFAGSKWARLAQLRIADSQFKQGNFAESITAYREFLRDYPSDQHVPYARYQVILCQFRSRGDGTMSPPLEERDLANVRDAARSIDAFLRDYPAHPELEQVVYMREWVRGMLARHELYVARFYMSRSNLDAAVARTEYALTTYHDTGLEPEALVLLGEIQMKRGLMNEARTAFLMVKERYPESPFVEPADHFLKQMLQAAASD